MIEQTVRTSYVEYGWLALDLSKLDQSQVQTQAFLFQLTKFYANSRRPAQTCVDSRKKHKIGAKQHKYRNRRFAQISILI